MFIQTEDTPNPSTLKFIPGVLVMPNDSIEFSSSEETSSSPLAQLIFNIEGVSRVFFGHDFITVTKTADRSWPSLKAPILAALMSHFTQNLPVFTKAPPSNDSHRSIQEDDPVVVQIRELLDLRIRPAVAQDGGDIVFRRFEEGVVYVTMKGACAGCPSSTATLKSGIENMMRHYIPEVTEVRAEG